MCELEYLKNLAVWTAAAEASVPPLAAFFGERFAAASEALGLRFDSCSFVCERCESMLQPGHNCTVRIEKSKSRVRRRCKKPNPTQQNNVVYKCHFCSHRNLMRGTPMGYIKEICPPKPKPDLIFKAVNSAVKKHPTLEKATATTSVVDYVALPPSDGQNLATAATSELDFVALPPSDGQNLETVSPATPLAATRLSLLDSKRKKRTRSGVKKVAEPETTGEAERSVHVSSKRRKKAWTSLKEIAESSGRGTDACARSFAPGSTESQLPPTHIIRHLERLLLNVPVDADVAGATVPGKSKASRRCTDYYKYPTRIQINFRITPKGESYSRNFDARVIRKVEASVEQRIIRCTRVLGHPLLEGGTQRTVRRGGEARDHCPRVYHGASLENRLVNRKLVPSDAYGGYCYEVERCPL